MQHSHQLPLRPWVLEVQAAQHTGVDLTGLRKGAFASSYFHR